MEKFRFKRNSGPFPTLFVQPRKEERDGKSPEKREIDTFDFLGESLRFFGKFFKFLEILWHEIETELDRIRGYTCAKFAEQNLQICSANMPPKRVSAKIIKMNQNLAKHLFKLMAKLSLLSPLLTKFPKLCPFSIFTFGRTCFLKNGCVNRSKIRIIPEYGCKSNEC